MELLSPSYLWGLPALLIPVVIHLWSKRVYKTVLWPVIKFIPERSSHKAATVHWEETLLFVIRALILLSLILFLADPVFKTVVETEKKQIILIDSELLKEKSFAQVLDTLSHKENVYVLTYNFPAIADYVSPQGADTTNYWKLLKTLPASQISGVKIYTPAFMRNFGGRKPALHFPVEWQTWPVSWESEGFSVDLANFQIEGSVNASSITYRKKDVDTSAVRNLSYYIDLPNYDDQHIKDGINALLKIVGEYVDLREMNNDEADISFSDGKSLGNRLNIVIDTTTMLLSPFKFEKGKYYLNSKLLEIQNLIRYDIVLKFFDLLKKEGLLPVDDWRKFDTREMPLHQIQTKTIQGSFNQELKTIYLSTYILLLLFLLIILERFLVMSKAK